MSNGSKPRSSSCCCLDEPKPNAACQSVDDDTGMVSEVKRLCGSGAVGQSALLCVELGKRPLGSGFGCRKLLLSENNDCEFVVTPSNGEEETVWPVTLIGTTKLGLVRPGGGDGESLLSSSCEVSPFPILMIFGSLSLARSQFEEKMERAGTGPRLRSGSGPSGVKCSESEPSKGGLFLWSDDRPFVVFPDGCNQPSLLELFDLCKEFVLPFGLSPATTEVCRKVGFIL